MYNFHVAHFSLDLPKMCNSKRWKLEIREAMETAYFNKLDKELPDCGIQYPTPHLFANINIMT